MMRSIWRRSLAACLGLLLMLGVSGYALAADETVTSDAEFSAALSAATPPANIYLNYDCAMDGIAIPSGTTVHVIGGHVWHIGSAVSGSVVVESGAILCAAANDVSIDDGVYVALPLTLTGAADGETVAEVAADSGALTLYGAATVSGGTATVYASKQELSAVTEIRSVRTSAGEYVQPLSGGGELARRHTVSYSDMVDAAGRAPSTASNAASINPGYFTAADTAITLTDPTLAGAVFLGWTWEGQPVPQTGVSSIACTGLTSLSLVAHWQATQQGARRSSGGLSLAAAAEEETEDTAAAPAEDTAAQGTTTVRVPRGSSSTKVHFSDGDVPTAALPAAEQTDKPAFPWIVPVIVAVAVAAGVVILCLTRRNRRR